MSNFTEDLLIVSQTYDGEPVYRLTDDVTLDDSTVLKKGWCFYLNSKTGSEIIVFDGCEDGKSVLQYFVSLNGTVNKEMSQQAKGQLFKGQPTTTYQKA